MRITLSGVKRRLEPSMWLRKLDAVFVDGAQRGEREHLKAAGVGEDRPVPLHELVQAAQLANQLVAGPEVQVIGVGEDHLRVHRVQIVGVERLHRGERAHRHERRASARRRAASVNVPARARPARALSKS